MASLTKLWEHPDVSSTGIEQFRKLVNKRHGLALASYDDLWEWSVQNLNDLWMLVWEFTQVQASIHPATALSGDEATRLFPPPSWFPDARLNFAQNILESAAIDDPWSTKPVLTGIRELEGEVEHVSLSQLRERVRVLAAALKSNNVRPGDRVACICANSIDTFVILLAAAAVGAIFTCSSPEAGEQAILGRFTQVHPKILFADDWAVYNGKRIPCLPKARQVAAHLRSTSGLETLIIVPRFDKNELQDNPRQREWSLSGFTSGVSPSAPLEYAQVPFNHPFLIVYSSGTTGQPKCMVHTQGGVMIKQKLEQTLCMDMTPQSVYLQYSSTSWFMHIYAVCGLLSGARSVLYDGSPLKPDVLRLFRVMAQEKVTHFGTSAHYLNLLEQAGVSARDTTALKSLKVITSTASVLHEPQYHWVYKTFGPVHLMSMSGGTEVAGTLVGGAPTVPVYAGWCQARTLGMDVHVFSEDGEVMDASNEPGELVCTKPFPSQPAYFWADDDGKRYRAAYFERFPGIWHQGDFIRMDPETKGIVFLGRSDGVLNPSGVRFGSAEVYNCLSVFPEIEDSLCIGRKRPHDRDEQVLLFVKVAPGSRFDDRLRTAIETRIRQSLSPRHVPRLTCETPEIPMTISGKKTELPVKKIVSGQKITPSSTIVNPGSLKWYEQFAAPDQEPTAKL